MSPNDAASLIPLPLTTDSCEENKTDDECRSLSGNLKDQLPTEDLKKGFKLTLLAVIFQTFITHNILFLPFTYLY